MRDDVSQRLDSRGSDGVLFGESSDLWGRKRERKAARVATLLMGETSDQIEPLKDICIMSRTAVRSLTQMI